MAENKPTDADKKTIAVALSHNEGSKTAPIVTATGRGELAEQILKIAFENGVRVREDSDLAQVLSQVDVDCPIPLEAFAAVSEILSYLYRAQNIDAKPPVFELTGLENDDQ